MWFFILCIFLIHLLFWRVCEMLVKQPLGHGWVITSYRILCDVITYPNNLRSIMFVNKTPVNNMATLANCSERGCWWHMLKHTGSHPWKPYLVHWGPEKMAAILQTTFSKSFFVWKLWFWFVPRGVTNSSDARDGIFWFIWSIQCLLMPWLLKLPGHQQTWYWQYRNVNK